VKYVVSRGGRPDLASACLPAVQAPTLLIVGADDDFVVELNRQAFRKLRCTKELAVIPGATHLFEEPGALEEVARLAKEWFLKYLGPHSANDKHQLRIERQTMFRNREDAAYRLAAVLKERDMVDLLVLAIPRGGVVTGAVLAQELGAELDVVLSRKLRAPFQPELAIGAISEDGRVYLNHYAEEILDLEEQYMADERRHQLNEIARRKKLIRSVRPQAAIAGRSVIVTDDGIATGSTMIAALQIVKAQKPRELIVAVPVSSPDRLEEVRRWCDDLICLLSPEDFYAIGQFYEDFAPVEDVHVIELLRANAVPQRTSI
jgi:predicted phosphoribosyltransferase